MSIRDQPGPRAGQQLGEQLPDVTVDLECSLFGELNPSPNSHGSTALQHEVAQTSEGCHAGVVDGMQLVNVDDDLGERLAPRSGRIGSRMR
jgi:hypothetical protein